MVLEKRSKWKVQPFFNMPGMSEEAIQALQNLIAVVPLYRGAMKEVSTKLEVLDEEFQVLYDHNPIHHIESRMKSLESIVEKMQRKSVPFLLDSLRTQITDIAGLRVICNYVSDIYRLSEMLLSQDDVHLVRRTDYIENPKPNGYRSLHLIIKVPVFLSKRTELVPVEVQLRTIAMDMWASLEHELRYKADHHLSHEASAQELKRCAEELAAVDQRMQSIYKGTL